MTVTAALDLQTVRRWLGVIHGDSPGHVHICSTGDWRGRVFPATASGLDAATEYVAHLDAEGREGIYLRITSLRPDRAPRGRGSAADSAALPALWADLDLAGPGHAEQDLPPDEAAGRQVIADSGLPEPTIWVHSGGGLYPIWLLDQPAQITEDNLDDLKALARDWQRVIEHAAAARGWRYGRGVGDLARVLRIPGTINRKAGLARPCRIISVAPHRYTIEQLQTVLAKAIQRITPPESTATSKAPVLAPGAPRDPGQLAPGDDFNARVTWAQILEPAGWREYYRSDDVTYWTRPGKPSGISASTNALGTDRLYVFSTNAAPLEGGESYSKFGAYATLYFGGDFAAAAKALARQGYGSPPPDPAAEQAEMLRDLIGYLDQQPAAEPQPAAAEQASGQGADEVEQPRRAPTKQKTTRIWIPEIDVSNTAIAADWLREEAGRGRLAGLFRRFDTVVHTPREGEAGYIPLGDDADDDGPAQVRPITDSELASRISYSYGVYRMVKRGENYEPVPALFPRAAARTALDVPDMLPNLRPLRGVIHSPVLRPDGSIITAPGYDSATGLLYLPEPGLRVPPIPDAPTDAQLRAAVGLIDEMLGGFPFVSPHYRANYIGMLITPLLRAIAPPPYKLHAIEAHQPGSGKTLLANLARIIHGGVFRAEMPSDDVELRKQITAILSITTGPVVVLDNVTGVLKSSTLAGLLTSDRWDDRPLGSTSWIRATNDRVWVITGNNINIGGDLPRRTIRTVIDPGQPNPELRTGFAIPDLEGWVREKRGELLAALLTIVRSWVVAGMPLPAGRASDGYTKWVRIVSGILAHAGIPGTFDDRSTQVEIGTDDDEWATFLTAAWQAVGDKQWTAKELLAEVDTGNLINPGRIPLDALPSELAEKAARSPHGAVGVARSLTWWLRNREGRWAGGLTVRSVGKDANKVQIWRIQTNKAGGQS